MPREDYAGLFSVMAPLLVFCATGLAVLTDDWNWAIFSGFAGIVSMLPPIKGSLPKVRPYCVFLLPFVAYVILSLASIAVEIPYHYEIGLALLSCAGFSLAFFSLLFLQSGGYPISRKWINVISVSFAWAICALAVFTVFAHMADIGMPVYNEDYNHGEDNDHANWMLMLPITIGIPVAIVYALAVRSLRGWIEGGGGP